MKKDKIKEIYKNLIVIIISTAFLISILALIYNYTKDKILINETLFKKKAVLLAAGFALPDKNQDILNIYNQSIEELGIKNNVEIFRYKNLALKDEDLFSKGYVIVLTGSGLWGEITMALAFGKDLKTIAGIEFISQNETPGLGGRIVEPWFKRQFKGKINITNIVEEKQKAAENEISAITGATNTTKYVLKIIENGKKYLEQFNLSKFE